MAAPYARSLALVLLLSFLPLPAAQATWGFLATPPPNLVTVTSLHRNNVFYVGDIIVLRLTNPSAAVTYEIRDYWGNMVEQGPAAEFIYPQVTDPGWYKIYLRGAQFQTPWGYYVGESTFVIFRNTPNFPPLPPPSTWGGDGLDDGIIRGIAGIGPDRHEVDCTNAAASIAAVSAAIAVDNQYYTPFDPVRHRKLLCSFANGTTNLAGVAQIVTALKGSVKYWEPLNEPNFSTDAADFVNNQLIPFYNTIKGIDPTLKVLGPEIVTIGPPEQGWVSAFIAAGGLNYIDGFSFHAYNNVNGDLTLTRETMSYLDSILANYPNLERWQTEQGYDAALFGSYQPRLQGRWTMLQMMVFDQHGIPKEQNHLWYDKSGGYWTAPTWWENLDGTLNPGAPLMRVWSEELFGTTYSSALDFGNPGNKLYVGNLYSGPGKKVAAIMTAGSPCETVQLTDSGDSTVQVVSSFGLTRTLPVQSGTITLPVTELPTYLEYSGTIAAVPINSGSDLALMPGVTGTSSGDGLYPPDHTVPNSITKVFDGVLQNWYWTQTSPTHPWMDDTPQFPAWVEIDFPSPQTINNVIVYSGVPWQLDGTLLDYDLQYDSNGQWVTAGSAYEPTNTFLSYMPTNQTQVDSFFSDRWIFQHSFPAVQTGKIRLWVRDTTWGGGATQLITQLGGQTGTHNITLREIEVYNTGAAPTPPNQPPTASDQTVATWEDSSVDVPVLNGCFDPDNGPQPLHIESIGPAANGIVSKMGGIVRYNPSPAFSGTDAFTYVVSDGMATATANVFVTVNPVTTPYPPLGGLIGLTGSYYNTQNFTGLVLTRADGNIDFNWGFNPPAPSMPQFHYSVYWSGLLQPRYSENYTFYTLTSDGACLWVNGQQLVNDWQDQPATLQSWNIPLRAGQQYPIVMEYYSDMALSTAVLSWSSPSQPLEPIPAFPAIPPLVSGGLVMALGQYYNNQTLTDPPLDSRIERAIDFNWTSAAPFPNINQASFSVRWTGQILAQYSEPYTFQTTSDDGIRLWVNGTEIINNWTNHSATVNTGTMALQAGQYYPFEMDYYQAGGGSVAQLQWSCPSQPLADVHQLPEEAWRLATFSSAQLAVPSLSGPAGSASGDGIPNRLKYAFDINPLDPVPQSALPALSFLTDSGRTYMALVYRRNSAVTDLTYDVQVNSSLASSTWTTVSSPEEIIGQDSATGDLFIRRRVDVTGLPTQFMRLNIW